MTPVMNEDQQPVTESVALSELTTSFLRLGLTAFGGPAAHISMMRQEFVERRKWLKEEDFLDLIGVANLIPGPSSTEVAIYIGYRKAGWPGLLVAGICFILPAFLMVLAIAWGYQKIGQFSQADSLMQGLKPVVIAVVVQAIWGLSKTAFKSRLLAVTGVLALIPAALGLHPLAILMGAGAILMAHRWYKERTTIQLRPLLRPSMLVVGFIAITMGLARFATGSTLPSVHGLFLVFLKIGTMVYGSGYVLLSFLKTDLVQSRHWLQSPQLLDSVAVGQVTPGPVFTTATFIGFLIGGWQGAIAATIGIFLPAFILVGITGPLLLGVRKSPLLAAFLDGVNVAALALMAVVAWQLGTDALRSPLKIVLAVVSLVLLIRFKINSAWLVLLGGIIGLLAGRF